MQNQTSSTIGRTMAASPGACLMLLAWLSISGAALADEDRPSDGTDDSVIRKISTSTETPTSWDVTLSNGEYGGRMGRIPPGTRVRRYTIDESDRQREVASFDGRSDLTLIYSNTNSLEPLPGGGALGVVWHRDDGRVADDMRTIAVTPCELGEIRVEVHGGNLDASADVEDYSVTLQLWDDCPSAGGQVIPLATGDSVVYNGLADNELSILTLPLLPGTVPPDTTIWVSGLFPDNDIPGDPLHVGAGFIVGSPPEKGFSRDCVLAPGFGCCANFGGWPEFPHASIAAKIFARGACETHFFAYLAVNNSQTTFDRGRNNRIADDLTLTVDDCELSSYEIGVIGQARVFALQADLRTGPFTGPNPHPVNVIPGTEGLFLGVGQGNVEVARFEFPPGISVPQEVWVTWTVNQRNTGVILTQDTQIGTGSDLYAYESDIGRCSQSPQIPCRWDSDCPDSQTCVFWTGEDFPGPDTGIFYVSLNCRGEPPVGACCRVPDETTGAGGVCADNTTAAGCPLGRWMHDASCSPDPFFPACGTAACCFENSEGDSDCENLTKAECDVRSDCSGPQCVKAPGIWQPGSFCGDDDHECFYFGCYYATEPEADCLREHPPEQVCERDAECLPSHGWFWGCDWSGTCTGTGDPCRIDGPEFCLPSRGCPAGHDCHPSSDCPPGECCATQLPVGRCAYPSGCNNIRCCNRVCTALPQCCQSGSGWEFWCGEEAQRICPLPPINDECFDPDDPRQGPQVIPLEPDGAGGWEAFRSINNLGLATWNHLPPFSDPFFCCNNLGVDVPGAMSLWYLVGARETSMWVSTCDSSEQSGLDSIIQVLTPQIQGTPQQECGSLERIACNDDAGCGVDGRLSRVCLRGLVPGEPVYIQFATPSTANAIDQTYTLTIRQPCPNGSEPMYTSCLGAKSVPAGAADVPFECPPPVDGVCLAETSLVCEGLDPTEECFTAMKNDVWIEYTPNCTGLLSINTCASPPLASPDTTLAVYGATTDFVFERACPIEGGILLDCNDDAVVNAEQHLLRPQGCTLGRNPCETDDDCPLIDETCENNQCVTICGGPGTCPHEGQVCVKGCSISGDPCEISTDCPGSETCDFDHCERPCDTDRDCALRVCSKGGNLCADDNDCDVGICSWNQSMVCDVSEGLSACLDVCRNVPGIECDRLADPGEPGSCPTGTGPCIPQTCIRDETCDGEVCQSSCWPGSTVKVPVSDARSYRVRLGGEFGSEPEGALKFDCEPQDCNLDRVPDVCNADCEAMDGACDQWFLLCGTAQECHSANKRCTVSGSYDLSGTPCTDNADCVAPEICSSGFDTLDPRYDRIDICDIVFGASEDCNRNGMPDECEIRDDPALDVFPPPFGNGTLDECEDVSICGDGVVSGTEVCDGDLDEACAGQPCRRNCTCAPPTCGDGIRDPDEACDGDDDALCRTLGCRSDCTCRLPKPRTPKLHDLSATRIGHNPIKATTTGH